MSNSPTTTREEHQISNELIPTKQERSSSNHPQTLHGTRIFTYFTYIYHKSKANVGKYSSPMEYLGSFFPKNMSTPLGKKIVDTANFAPQIVTMQSDSAEGLDLFWENLCSTKSLLGGFLRGGVFKGEGGSWGTLRIPREDWGGMIRGNHHSPLRILLV